MQRLQILTEDEMTDAQRDIVAAVIAGPRGRVPVLFQPWLRVPELADRAQRLGEFCRYKTSLGPRLSELTILTVARHWTAQYEWYSHEGPAREAGLTDDVIEDLSHGKTPIFENDDEQAVHTFVTELQTWREVSDETYDATKAVLGEGGVAELVCIVGYYTMAAMTLNVFRLPVPDSAADPLS
jgi:4-carboxymuconolactone decarboxylase